MKSFEEKKKISVTKNEERTWDGTGKKQDDSKWIEMKADEAENPSFLLQRPKDSDQLEKNCTL